MKAAGKVNQNDNHPRVWQQVGTDFLCTKEMTNSQNMITDHLVATWDVLTQPNQCQGVYENTAERLDGRLVLSEEDGKVEAFLEEGNQHWKMVGEDGYKMTGSFFSKNIETLESVL